MLRSLVLATALLSAPLSAQIGDPWHPVLPPNSFFITWNGRPAVLIVSPHLYFLRYPAWPLPLPPRPRLTPTYRFVAAYFEDRRPCAPGSPVALNHHIDGFYGPIVDLGKIGQDGTLTYYAPGQPHVPGQGHLLFWSQRPSSWHEAYSTDYCGRNEICFSLCKPGQYDQPPFSAIVLARD
jgi:hypothetical protein